MIKRLLLATLLVLLAVPAEASIYYRPTWDNLVKTLVRFGAMDLSDNKILDEYVAITDCDLYRTFSINEFKWEKVRDATRASVEMNLQKFPMALVYDDKLMLGKYDIDQQLFNFSDKNPIQKVNAFFLFRSNGQTCNKDIIYFPKAFRAVIDEPVNIPGLPLTPRNADALIRRMDANNNANRIIYARFNLHVNYIGKLSRPGDGGTSTSMTYRQAGAGQDVPVLINTQVDTIEFYEDERYTKLLYSYQP